MKVEQRHLTGIALDFVETNSVAYQRGSVGSATSWYELLPDMSVSVSAKPAAEATCDVFVKCTLEGTEGWKLEGEVRGHFRVPEGSRPAVDLETFGKRHAIVILLPFLRQLLAAITAADERLGAFVLPPINLVSLLEEADKQAQEGDVSTAPAPRQGATTKA